MSERDDFENHMRRLNPCVRLARQKTDGTYRTVSVQRAWDLWQAAALPDAVIMRLRTAGNMLSNCAGGAGMTKFLWRNFWAGFWEGANVLFWLAWALYGLGHLSCMIANLGGPKFWVVFWARAYQVTMLASVRVQDRYGFSSPWGHIAK